MSFDHPTSPTAEELRIQEKAALAELLKFCEESVIPPPVELRESGPEIIEFERMVASFEATHSIEALYLITDLTVDEAKNHPVREPARIAVGLIDKKLTSLKRETNISPAKHAELKREYNRLSFAVGFLNNNKVDHEPRGIVQE